MKKIAVAVDVIYMTRDELTTIRFALATTIQHLDEKLLPVLEAKPNDRAMYAQLLRTLEIARKLQGRFDRLLDGRPTT